MTQISHRPTTGEDLTWLAKRMLGLLEIAASETERCAEPGGYSDPHSETEAFLTGDDSGDYLGCAIDALSALRPWMAHDGPELSDNGGFSLGDIRDLDTAINNHSADLPFDEDRPGYYSEANERIYSERDDRADALRSQLEDEAPTIAEMIEMMGCGH